MSKKWLITEILQVCKISEISSGRYMPMNEVFISLVGMTESELKKVAHELNIKTD